MIIFKTIIYTIIQWWHKDTRGNIKIYSSFIFYRVNLTFVSKAIMDSQSLYDRSIHPCSHSSKEPLSTDVVFLDIKIHLSHIRLTSVFSMSSEPSNTQHELLLISKPTQTPFSVHLVKHELHQVMWLSFTNKN